MSGVVGDRPVPLRLLAGPVVGLGVYPGGDDVISQEPGKLVWTDDRSFVPAELVMEDRTEVIHRPGTITTVIVESDHRTTVCYWLLEFNGRVVRSPVHGAPTHFPE